MAGRNVPALRASGSAASILPFPDVVFGSTVVLIVAVELRAGICVEHVLPASVLPPDPTVAVAGPGVELAVGFGVREIVMLVSGKLVALGEVPLSVDEELASAVDESVGMVVVFIVALADDEFVDVAIDGFVGDTVVESEYVETEY